MATDFDGTQICAAPDTIGRGQIAMWPIKDVTVYASGKIGGIDVGEAMARALPAWNEVCGINLSMTPHHRTANIGVGIGHIDNPGGTLAWSELPVNFSPTTMRQIQQKYDRSEAFVIADNPPRGKIDLVRVMRHEIGHAIGISHIVDGNLMQPRYSTRISIPQVGDIKEARARYGTPTARPEPDPDPTPSPGGGYGFLIQLVFRAIQIWGDLPPETRSQIFEIVKVIWGRLSDRERSELKHFWSEFP